MHSNNYEWFITQTVESMLPPWHDKNICLTMKIRMDWDYYPSDDDQVELSPNSKKKSEEEIEKARSDRTKSFKKNLLLVFWRPDNYTLVLSKDITRQHFFIDKQEMRMEQLSHHDSCWRSDGMNWVFKSFVESWDYFDQFGIEGRNIEPMFHYDIFNGAPAYRHIELHRIKEKNEDDWARWNSPYMVKIGKKIEVKEISKYMKGYNNVCKSNE